MGHRRHDVGIEWVIEGGERHHVSEYAHIKNTRARPVVVCPECGAEMRLKLGTINRHHASHVQENEQCPASRPETALHINTKFHLAAQLEAVCGPTTRLIVEERCLTGDPSLKRRSRAVEADRRTDRRGDGGVVGAAAGAGQSDAADGSGSPGASTELEDPGLQRRWEIDIPHCTETRSRTWVCGWDEVRVEDRVTGQDAVRVPDITLRRNGRVVGAVEVFATHAVSQEKAAVLTTLDVPWIEVQADPSLYCGESLWTVDAPLPVVREGQRSRWRCPDHQRQHDDVLDRERRDAAAVARETAREAARAAEEAARAAEAARHTSRVLAAKVVDINYPSGKWYRHVYVARELATDGLAHSITLHRSQDLVATISLAGERSVPQRDAAREVLARYEVDVEGYRVRLGAIVDSPMRWARGTIAERLLEAATRDWDRGTRRPVVIQYPWRYRFVASTQRWWLPDDQRSVNWDRADDDPFDAHPASTYARATERARATGTAGGARSNGGERREPRERPAALIPLDATPAEFGRSHAPSIYQRSTIPLAASISAEELGPAASVTRRSWGSVTELPRAPGVSARVLVCLASAITKEIEREVLRGPWHDAPEIVWLSTWAHWSSAFPHLRWLPTARDGHHIPLVVFENEGLMAEEFARAFASDDPDLSLDRITTSGRSFIARRIAAQPA